MKEYTFISLHNQEQIGIVSMKRGITNAIHQEMINELSDAFHYLKEDPNTRSAVLTSANEKFFSIGFDVPTLYELSKEDFSTYYRSFNQLWLDLFTIPKPTFAAITGHATGAGCILSLCCDYRITAEGRRLMSLPEINLGIPVPYIADCILRELTGLRYAREIMDTGALYNPQQLLLMGMVDEVVSTETLLSHCMEKALFMGNQPELAFQMIKKNRTEVIESQIRKFLKEKEQYFIDCWHSGKARQLLKKALEKF